MVVSVRLFGPEAQLAGAQSLDVEVVPPATCGALRELLLCKSPELAGSLRSARFAVNHTFASDETIVEATDEIALIGMVSGG